MSTAASKIGKIWAGAKVGELTYDWPYAHDDHFSENVYDTTTWERQTLNGAWGAWDTIPNVTDLRPYALKAGNVTQITAVSGWGWNAIDDGLEGGKAAVEGQGGDWDLILDTIDSTVSWLFGNVREGGCGLLKYDTNNVFVLSTYGTYTNNAGDEKIAATSGNTFLDVRTIQEGVFAVFHWNVRNSWSSYISYVYGVNGGPYMATDPSQEGDSQYINLLGSNCSISDTLYRAVFPVSTVQFLQEYSEEIVYPLVDMNSIASPYQQEFPLYYPEHTIDITGWDLTVGGPDGGDEDSESLGGGDDPSAGDGDYDSASSEIDLTGLDQFTIDAQDCGFCTVYNPDKEELKSFAKWLFSTHPEGWSDWIDEIKKIWDNPMDCIMSLNMAHYQANTAGERDISFFGQESGYSAPIVDGLVQILDCEYLDPKVSHDQMIHEYTGSFMDYTLSAIKIYVPYCGVYDLNPAEVMNSKPHLQYVIDLLTGACVAELKCTRKRSYVTDDPDLKSVLYTFTGNIFQQIPIGATNYTNILQGQLGLAASVASLSTGNVAGAAAGAVSAVMSMSPTMQRLGNTGASYGYMSLQKPFIIYEYAWYNWPDNNKYNKRFGRPLYRTMKLSACHGYTEIDPSSLWIDDFAGITKDEADELVNILNTSGIYLD